SYKSWCLQYTSRFGLRAHARVEQVAQAIAHKVKCQDQEQNRRSGHARHPRVSGDVVAAFADHHAPFGCRRLGTETDKGETSYAQNRSAHIEGDLDQERCEQVGHDMAQQHQPGWYTKRSSRLDKLAVAQSHHLGAYQTGI